MSPLRRLAYWVSVGAIVVAIAQPVGGHEGASAQPPQSGDGGTPSILDQLDAAGQFGGLAAVERLTLSGQYQLAAGSREGQLSLTANLDKGWHVYSTTQKDGGPQRSTIEVLPADQFQLAGRFQPSTPPEVKHYEFFKVPVEEHAGKVTWTAAIRLHENVDPEKLTIRMKFSGQICADAGSCIPIGGREVEARFTGYYQPAAPTIDAGGGFRAERSHATIRGYVEPKTIRPGDSCQLVLSAEPDPEWHVYAYAAQDPQGVAKPTLIVVTPPANWQTTAPVPSVPPVEQQPKLLDESVFYHEGAVSWLVKMQVPRDATAGVFDVTGSIGYQTCTSSRCDLPTGADFRAAVTVGPAIEQGRVPLAFTGAKYAAVAQAAARQAGAATGSVAAAPKRTSSGGLDLDKLQTESPAGQSAPMGIVLLTALAAGFILNFMPCVLPVIGLKIMAFVQQSGESRGRVFMLNVWYSLGLMAVFLVLASLVVGVNMSWGRQFSSATFNVVLSSVVFVFALSLLGVWEIPIPGFVGSGEVQSLAEKEGAVGAFAKGVLTTILATPCSGPMLTPALTWAVLQPPLITYAAFACVGLGMASPYLLIGAFPVLISFLPRPGAWMDTFKHIMGFVLLGTLVFLLSFMPVPYVVPTVAFVIGLWAAFWWIGRTPLTESFQRRLRAWLGAAAFATLVGLVAFGWLLKVMDSRFQWTIREWSVRSAVATPRSSADTDSRELPWQPFSIDLLSQLTGAGRTVFVDFTADW